MHAAFLSPEYISTEKTERALNSILEYFANSPNPQSLCFMQTILQKNPDALHQLPSKLKRYAAQLQTHLTAKHLDVVIDAFYQQHILSLHPMHTEDYIQLSTFMAKIITQPVATKNKTLGRECLRPATCSRDPEILPHEQAYCTEIDRIGSCGQAAGRRESNCQHALEQTLQIMENLNLLTEHTERNLCIKQIMLWLFTPTHTNFSVESMELRINELFNQDLLFAKPSIRALINFLANRLLILAMTSINGPTRTMLLSELFFILEAIATNASLRPPNQAKFIHEINAIMLIISVCEYTPITFYDAIPLTLSPPHSQTLTHFFSTPLVQAYFCKQTGMDPLSQQVFKYALTLQMTKSRHNDSETRKNCMQRLKSTPTNLNSQQLIADLQYILFDTIDETIAMQLSHVGSVVFSANKLISMGFSPRSYLAARNGIFQPLINPEVIVTHAKNLKAFSAFFQSLNKANQEKMLQEIFLLIK